MGAWCGYVGVPPGHKLYGMGYDDVYEFVPELSVHGGLTYAEPCQGPVCHVPKPGEPDEIHWFGFDLAHSGDYVPSMGVLRKSFLASNPKDDCGMFAWQEWERYRDIYYCEEQAIDLARQLAEV